MSELRMLKCLNCGAPLDPKTLKCNYCGTYHERTHEGIVHIIKSIPVGTTVLRAHVALTRDFTMSVSDEHIGRYVRSVMANKISQDITNYMDVGCEYDPFEDMMHFAGKLRIIEPDFRF